MYKPISLFIALRYLWNAHLPKFKKIIVLLSIMGICISTTSLIIIISITNGSEENFKKNILSFIPHLIITNKNQYIKKSEFPKNILKLNNIEKISDFISKTVVAENQSGITMAEIIGIDSTNYENVSNYDNKNLLHILQKGNDNIIIGKQLAKKLNINIGDTIKLTILSNKKFFSSKKILNQHIFKIISIFSTNSEVDHYQILMNKEDSLKFLKYSKNYVTGWRIWLRNPLYLDRHQIQNSISKLVLLDWQLQKGEFFKAMQVEKYIMLFLFFLILLVSVLNVFITLTIHILEKKNTIAILKTLGLPNWKIMLTFIILGSSTAIIGNILGVIISIALIVQNNFLKFFINLFFNDISIKIVIIPYQIFFITIISVLCATFSILYPAWNSIRLQSDRILDHE